MSPRQMLRRAMAELTVPGLPKRVDPRRRKLIAALDYIRDHPGEDYRRLMQARERRARRMGEREARELEHQQRFVRQGDITVGDVVMFGDMVEWRVMESRPAGDGLYVLVVQR